MHPGQPKPAVIYTRVSSRAQVKRGDGLASQETRCRETARMRGYEVVAAFSDDKSGALIDRPGMKAMLSFLRRSPHRHVVLIDDISRLARGVKAHIELRSAIALAGGMLESPSLEFGDERADATRSAIADASAHSVHDQSALRRILDQSIAAHSAGA